MPVYKDTSNDSNTYDALIIGAGPAGLTAAIYLCRAQYKVGFIEKDVPGGKIVNTPRVENYPGAGKTDGADLALKMYQQAIDLGAQYIYGNVSNFDSNGRYFRVYTEDGVTRYCKTLLIASGTTENKLDLPNEKELEGKGVSHCAICDGSFTQDKNVAIVGSGAGALGNALYLSSIAKHVYMLNRSEQYKDKQDFLKQIATKENVSISYNTKVTKLIGQDKLEAIEVTDSKTNETKKLDVSYLFVYVGSNASTDFITDKSIIRENGTIAVNENMQTSIPGLYAIGDVNKIKVRQITVACADGTIAALNAVNYLEKWK